MDLRNTEHRQNTRALVEHRNTGGKMGHWQNNWNTTEWWNMLRAAEQRNSKTTPRNTINTE